MSLVDSHCHLDHEDFEKDLPKVIQRARKAGLTKILTICTKVSNLEKTIKISEKYDFIYFAFGLHPLNVGKEKITQKDILQVADHEKMVGIGETGLDYYYSKETISLQKSSLEEHIELSQTLRLPLIIHSRSADADMSEILLKQYNSKPFEAVMHCFTSGKSLAKTAIDLGFYLSMSGIITFSKSTDLKNIFPMVPINKVLIETDGPYLAPHPFRGTRNEPSFVASTCKKGAEIMNLSENTFKKITAENFKALFWKVKD